MSDPGYKLENDVINQAGRESLKMELQQFHKRILWKKQLRLWLRAVVIVLVVIVLLIQLKPRFFASPPATRDIAQQLFTTYFNPYPVAHLRGLNSLDTVLTKALNSYQQADFVRSANFFNALDFQNSIIQLYLGNALLASGQVGKAILILEKLAQSPIYEDEGRWYLALAYLRDLQIEQASIYFNQLSKHPNDYQEKSTLLLSRIQPFL